jgi:hypothetical protein
MNGDIKAFSEVRSYVEASEKDGIRPPNVRIEVEYVDPKKPESTEPHTQAAGADEVRPGYPQLRQRKEG